MSAVLVVGSFNLDHVWQVGRLPVAGQTRRGESFATGPGGKGFNQAVASARMGVATGFVAALGDDAIGAQARQLASREGISGHWAPCPPQPTGTACILVDANAQNIIVVNLGANEHLDPGFVRQTVATSSARVLLCQLETNLDAVSSALSACRAGTLRLLNPAPVHAQIDVALLALVDVLTPNETEFSELLQRLSGRRVDVDSLPQHSDADLHALCRSLPVPTVVLTLGARGCFVSHRDTQHHGDDEAFYRLPAEPVNAIDTTGAGDAFNGALAAALACEKRGAFRTAAIQAGRVAGLSTETRGAADAMPNLQQLRARYDRR